MVRGLLKLKAAILFLFIYFVSLNSFSQLPPPPDPPTTEEFPPCWPPPCVPIDGGITFLAIAGAAYAGRKLYDKKK